MTEAEHIDAMENAISPSLVRRLLPDLYADMAIELSREGNRAYKSVSAEEAAQYANVYVFLDERVVELRDQKKKLKMKYLGIDREIDTEIATCEREKLRLREAVRHHVIAVEIEGDGLL